jgi:hypothetical protein
MNLANTVLKVIVQPGFPAFHRFKDLARKVNGSGLRAHITKRLFRGYMNARINKGQPPGRKG